ncbi:AbrB/MazE/SpoVT family DNA-binding domain-containing protein [Staphylothermus hellenicus]|uniref:Transcriptional regulator, AbrB family n=1 Tax=Staphylothermus hellenicus (strain DSM 12710 / JCM 10830 / BK20S6-10-b1 / P8) TaxID=591019 RepID=D7DAR9_STAHD|nr:AbrB/MazE/SpoVT family DNA-binding domain-containing protein [Staphylothermus hellenicus]ADI31266.1 transcriptional regulator, AbrB family [Staphylothermus hellenicus DSM 12710]
MSIVKVTRKRQITLPKKICDSLGISPGDYVRVYIDENGKIIVEKAFSIDQLAGSLNPSRPLENLAEDLDEDRKVITLKELKAAASSPRISPVL